MRDKLRQTKTPFSVAPEARRQIRQAPGHHRSATDHTTAQSARCARTVLVTRTGEVQCRQRHRKPNRVRVHSQACRQQLRCRPPAHRPAPKMRSGVRSYGRRLPDVRIIPRVNIDCRLDLLARWTTNWLRCWPHWVVCCKSLTKHASPRLPCQFFFPSQVNWKSKN